MSYLHIENLYRKQNILNFKRCYALEKVHGTSAHIQFKRNHGCDGGLDHVCAPGCDAHIDLTFYSGGEKHDRFVKLFNESALKVAYDENFAAEEMIVYGEAYGGSQQKMGHTYGPELKFIVFDVYINDKWLAVPKMAKVAELLGLEVVPWEETSTELDVLNALRDKPSEVAVRRGMGADKQREGIVLRPLEEMIINNDQRVIAKHKIDKFGERNTPQSVHNVDPSKMIALAEANAIATEWVTEVRLSHVLDHLTVDGVAPGIELTGKVIAAMVEDVYREAKGEIVESKQAQQAISKVTAQLFKKHLQSALQE